MQHKAQNIPGYLIYEMIEGHPVYYNGYKDYLAGTKSLEEIMGSSFIQALIIANLVSWANQNFKDNFIVLTNEIGLQFDTKSWRLADIALLGKDKIKDIKNIDKYLPIPPEYVIEIDTKASFEDLKKSSSFDYFQQKTDALLHFGVEKVIWIFTQTKKIMVAESNAAWVIDKWSRLPIEIEGKQILITELLPDEYR